MLLLGAVADVLAGAVTGAIRRRDPWAVWSRLRSDLRHLMRERDLASPTELIGCALAVAASTVAASAALGLAGGSLALILLGFAGAAAGAHVTLADPLTSAGRRRLAGARRDLVTVEIPFLLAIAVPFLRWHASDVAAIHGAHAVLGPAFVVGSATTVTGVALGTAVLVVAGALRLPLSPGTEAGAHGGPGVASTVARWALVGALGLAAGSFVVGRGLATAGFLPIEVAVLGAAAAISILVATTWRVREALSARARLVTGVICAVTVSAAVVLVLSG